MRKCIDNSIIDTYTMNEKMIVLYHKSYLRKLNEQKRYKLRARRPLNELFGFSKKKDNKKQNNLQKKI